MDVQVAALIRTFAEPRRIAHQTIDGSLEQLDLPLAEAQIPLRAEFNNAMAAGTPLVWERPQSAGALAYAQLADELHRGGKRLRAVA